MPRKLDAWEVELELCETIGRLPDGAERMDLIDKFEKRRKSHYSFSHRWSLINRTGMAIDCCTDDGYDPSLFPIPRDVQIWDASVYGKSDIGNGGFHQFFGNGTGRFAPEMVEWFEKAGLKKSSKIIQKAIDVFGDQYSRSQAKRQEFLTQFTGERQEEYDPFHKLNNPFYASCTWKPDEFEAICDRWLREVCGVTSLHVRVSDLLKKT